MIVVSDLVGTLTTGSPTLGLVSWARHNQSALRANFFLARLLPRYFLARIGLIDMRKFGEWSMIASLPLIKNATEEMVREMALWSVDKVMWPKRRPDVLGRLARHKEQGCRPVYREQCAGAGGRGARGENWRSRHWIADRDYRWTVAIRPQND